MPNSGRNGSLLRSVVRLEGDIKRASSPCRVHVAWVIIPLLIVLSAHAGIIAWIMTRSEIKPYITVAINTNGTQRCGRTELDSPYPCIKNELYITSDEPIGPLRCLDDWFAETGRAPDNCQSNAFRIASDGKGVVIPEDGVYRVLAKITYFDRTNHHITLNVRIDPPHQGECLGNHACLAAKDSRAHNWLACHSHQPPAAANATRDFANCVVDGIRRFSAGDTLGLQVAIGYRELSAQHKATYMYIHKL